MPLGDANHPRVPPGNGELEAAVVDGHPERRKGVPEGARELEQQVRGPAVDTARGAAPGSGRLAEHVGRESEFRGRRSSARQPALQLRGQG
eukprot:12179974-Alexandrium_andersonii.AAC.1